MVPIFLNKTIESCYIFPRQSVELIQSSRYAVPSCMHNMNDLRKVLAQVECALNSLVLAHVDLESHYEIHEFYVIKTIKNSIREYFVFLNRRAHVSTISQVITEPNASGSFQGTAKETILVMPLGSQCPFPSIRSSLHHECRFN